MFKIFVKLLMFMLVLALAGPFIMRGPNGLPLMTLSDLKLPKFDMSLPSLGNSGESSSSNKGADSQQWIQWSGQPQFNPDKLTPEQLALLDIKEQNNLYYRWQDKNGVWQFSTLPNRNTLNYVVRTDPNANVLQSLSKEEIDKVFGRVAPTNNENMITKDNPLANGKGLENTLPIPTTVPVTEIPKLIDQAKDVQRIMEERTKGMEKMMQ